MSWHLSHRLTPVHRAVSTALLYSIGCAALTTSAHAATIGKTVVSSAQHEPLVATILVSDINVADFSASLADASVYQRMGLTPTASMSVRFKPTSATSGQVLISTSQPVSKPFADVVLSINDNGKRNMMPKTLLMPLSGNAAIAPLSADNEPTTNNTSVRTKQPNLPVVSTTNAKPLTVRRGAPPPLMPSSSLQMSASSSKASVSLPPSSVETSASNRSSSITAPNQMMAMPTAVVPSPSIMRPNERTTTLQESSRFDISESLNSAQNDNQQTDVLSSSITTEQTNQNNEPNNVSAFDTNSSIGSTDKPLDILNIQITRQIRPSQNSNLQNSINNTPMVAKVPSPLKPQASAANTPYLAPDMVNESEATSRQASANSSVKDSTSASAPKPRIENEPASTTSTATAATPSANYTVQRNDNLWLIAQQIAEQNSVDVRTVMNQIKAQNPDAFINQDADQLRADAQLNLPSYDVIPSQKKMESAISAQRRYSSPIAKPTPKKAAEKKPATAVASQKNQATKRAQKPVTTKTQTLPEAQFSVVAPGRDGQANGTQTKRTSATGNGLSTDILATLKASRQRTATQAKRLSETSNTLGNYSQKIQLQNQKLAELQARLKQLRNQ